LQALAVKQAGQELVTCRPADLLTPRMPKLREELAAKGLPVSDENAVLFAMFPRETEAFYKPAAPVAAPAAAPAAKVAAAAPVTAGATGPVSKFTFTVNDRRYETTVQDLN
jgi:pyruvate/oxaloacetate carboxyltransferase